MGTRSERVPSDIRLVLTMFTRCSTRVEQTSSTSRRLLWFSTVVGSAFAFAHHALTSLTEQDKSMACTNMKATSLPQIFIFINESHSLSSHPSFPLLAAPAHMCHPMPSFLVLASCIPTAEKLCERCTRRGRSSARSGSFIGLLHRPQRPHIRHDGEATAVAVVLASLAPRGGGRLLCPHLHSLLKQVARKTRRLGAPLASISRRLVFCVPSVQLHPHTRCTHHPDDCGRSIPMQSTSSSMRCQHLIARCPLDSLRGSQPPERP